MRDRLVQSGTPAERIWTVDTDLRPEGRSGPLSRTLDAYAASLREAGPWLGAFDFPFGLPRELVEQLGWPTDWPALLQHYRSLGRAEIRARFAAFCATRPVGGKFAHRACDLPAGSSPSRKVTDPVGVPPQPR